MCVCVCGRHTPGIEVMVRCLILLFKSNCHLLPLQVERDPAWGVERVDTVYDAIMAHYASQHVPGGFVKELLAVSRLPSIDSGHA